MLVFSAGMQKSGSGWYFNMTNDLLVETGYQDVRAVRDRHNLQDILQYENCNIGRPDSHTLRRLLLPLVLGNSFAVKSHASPTRSLYYLMRLGLCHPTYIYRDPRDIVLSAYNHGEQIRANGKTHTFGHLKSFDDAISFVADCLPTWEAPG